MVLNDRYAKQSKLCKQTLWVQFLLWGCTHQKHHNIQIKNNPFTSMFDLIFQKLTQQWKLWLWTRDMQNKQNNENKILW